MQTFITDSSDSLGVDNLDSKRLNKQLLEARQILNVLVAMRKDPNATPAWRNHPAVKMWKDHEFQLFRYCVRLVIAMNLRGISFAKNMTAINDLIDQIDPVDTDSRPDWMTDPVQLDRIITTHRASLYNKDPEYYAEWKYEADWVDKHRDSAVCCVGTKRVCNYYWPTHKES